MKLTAGEMLFGLQKNGQNGKAILEAVDTVLLEQLDELLFFLRMDSLLHRSWSVSVQKWCISPEFKAGSEFKPETYW
jgi:hypothetical protein